MGQPMPRPPPPPKVRPDDTYRIDRIDKVFRERSEEDPFGDRTLLHVLGVAIGFILGAIAGAAAVLLFT